MAALGKITHCTIHCAATPEGRDVQAKTINDWDIAKFGQKSYHYIILLDGTIIENLPLTAKGAHVARHNTGNIGICYIGGMDKSMNNPKDTRTPEQKKSLKELVIKLKKMYPNITVLGHRDWEGVNKACPSFKVKEWLASF